MTPLTMHLVEPLEPRCLLSAAVRPDLLIKTKTESAYVGDNLYNATGQNQSRSAPGGFYPTIYHLRIQNDGTSTDSFTLTATGARKNRWRVRFYDSQTTGYDGGVDISTAVLTTGWNTGPLSPGATKDIRFEVLALNGSLGGDSRGVIVTATSSSNPTQSDTVTATTTYTMAPAVEIRRENFDSSGVYLATVQNFGNVIDRMKITGPAAGRSYTVKYFDAAVGGNDITAAVTGKGWISGQLARGQSIPIRVQLSVARRRIRTFQLNATSTADKSRTDFALITNQPSPSATPPLFVIGAWSQPKGSFDKWQSRGINTMVQYESSAATIDEWAQAAVDRGLYMIRRPRPNPADDIGQKYLLAWAHPDEPDIASTGHPASYIAGKYAAWKAVDPDMPVWVNFSGGYVNHWQGNLGYNDYKPFLDNTDWVSSSIYPVTGWDRPNDLDAPGKAVDRLEKWSQGKPQFAVIETGDQELAWAPKNIPGPTPGQFRAQVWDSVIRGARGIIYFPQKFKPSFSYDNTPPEIVAEMQLQNARISALGNALLSPIDPPSLRAITAAPLEASWRFDKGKAYFIVLNTSAQSLANQPIGLVGVGRSGAATVESERRTVSFKRGTLTDSFAPYEAHVYSVG